ncbi:MAG TPA: hypothetical protein VMG10_32330 [Gemmataceae bacterium]|nr:hypothetical protein [Gemmataceae bacterium]
MMAISAGVAIYLGEETPDTGQEQHAASSSSDDQSNADSELVHEDTTPEPERPPEPPWLPEEKQAKVNEAIDRGVAWLRKKQTPEGYWAEPGDPLARIHPASLAALPALTLLECGVAADDPQVAKAVEMVRAAVPQLNRTYDLSLAILLLDRLHEEEDRPRIRTMTLRLAAGQQPNGGWSYHCPILKEDEELPLLTALEKTRPGSPLDLFQQGEQSRELGLFVRVPNADGDAETAIVKKLEPLELVPEDPPRNGEKQPTSELSEEERKKLLDSLPSSLRRVPALQEPSAFSLHEGNADNSNTQLAILALLVAPRYDVALERTLALVVRRFHAEQRDDGLWTYGEARPSPPRPSMTGAGLLGLAVKYGLVLSSSRHRGQAVTIQDAAIDKGLKALSGYIGHPLLWGRSDSREGVDRLTLYAMWSIERVGALYHLRTINGKEWYPWGVDLLLARQEGDGAWRVGQYFDATAVIDTCFALLFLRRADFARDLSKKLEFFTEGKSLAKQESR